MRYMIVAVCGVIIGMLWCGAGYATTYSIPQDKIDSQKIFFGGGAAFNNPGEIDYDTAIRATPEFEEVQNKKMEPGTGKYWILLSQASDRVVKAISEVGQEGGYDLIAAQSYLGNLDPAIPSDNITQLIIDKIVGRDGFSKK